MEQQPHSHNPRKPQRYSEPHEESIYQDYQAPFPASTLPHVSLDPYQRNYYNEQTQTVYPHPDQEGSFVTAQDPYATHSTFPPYREYAHYPYWWPQPRRAKQRMRKWLYITTAALVTALILVTVVTLAFIPRLNSLYPHPNGAQRPGIIQFPGLPHAANNTGGQSPFLPGHSMPLVLRQHLSSIRTQMANDLHTSPEALIQELQGGEDIAQVASNHGVSTTQLQQLISDTLHSNLQPEVDNGTLSQQQVDTFIERAQNNPAILTHLLASSDT
jgi:hypothetical protein